MTLMVFSSIIVGMKRKCSSNSLFPSSSSFRSSYFSFPIQFPTSKRARDEGSILPTESATIVTSAPMYLDVDMAPICVHNLNQNACFECSRGGTESKAEPKESDLRRVTSQPVSLAASVGNMRRVTSQPVSLAASAEGNVADLGTGMRRSRSDSDVRRESIWGWFVDPSSSAQK